MRFKRCALLIMSAVLLAGCMDKAPTEQEIKDLLVSYTGQSSCITSTLFDRFPVSTQRVGDNAPLFQRFVEAGLLERSGDSYQLTAKGEESYNPQKQGFCYIDHFVIDNIEVSAVDATERPALAAMWEVGFDIAPHQIADWMRNSPVDSAPELEATNKERVERVNHLTVLVGETRADGKLVIADPKFSFDPGLYLNKSW